MMNMRRRISKACSSGRRGCSVLFKQIAAAAIQAAAAISVRSMMMNVVMHVMVDVVRHVTMTGMMCRVMMMGGGRSRRGEQ
jgi:hypothetical protein